ncbi:MAG: 50S ribosomal protein L1 [Chlamydiae bacterium]|nr:50S ribosomal protein L1 [Chlamydiota bacterium]
MTNRSKRYKEILKLFDNEKSYSLTEAIEILKKSPPVKFDESIEVALRLGVDPKKSDQQVRSTVFLPHGTGKTLRVIVLAKGEKATEAKDAGADAVGDKELIDKIKGGWTDFDVLVATPDMMRDVGKLGKILGPRGLMPTPKAGTVTKDVKRAVEDLKKGKIEFKVDKNSVINNYVGKVSFTKEQLLENITSLLNAVTTVKPASSKGQFLRSLFVSSSMGAGIKIDINSILLS